MVDGCCCFQTTMEIGQTNVGVLWEAGSEIRAYERNKKKKKEREIKLVRHATLIKTILKGKVEGRCSIVGIHTSKKITPRELLE